MRNFCILKLGTYPLGLYGDESITAKGIGYVCIRLSNQKLYMLANCYYTPDVDVDTFSPGGLKIYSGFRRATHEPLDHCYFVDPHGNSFYQSVDTDENHLDFVRFQIVRISHPSTTTTSTFTPIVNNIITNNPSTSAAFIHQQYGHHCHQHLQKLADSGKIKGLPKRIPKLQVPCPLCRIAKGTTIPRVLQDNTVPPIGTRLHLDFTFFNVTSIYGYTAGLLAIDATTRMTWGFPTRSKRPPVHILRFLIRVLRKQGRNIQALRLDEGGELARSSDFMSVAHHLDLVVESTGGYTSSLNGKAERPFRTIKNMIRVQLMSRAIDDKLWCCCFQYSIWLLRRLYNRTINDIPILLWFNNNIQLHHKEFLIFGCKVYIVNSNDKKPALSPRTLRDPRKFTNATSVQLDQQADGYFVGYGATTKVMLVYNPTTHRIQRTHHAYADPFDIRLHQNEKLTPGSLHLREYPNGLYNPSPINKDNLDLIESHLDLKDSPFNVDDIFTITITLPLQRRPIGITITDDEHFNIPIIDSVTPGSSIALQLPREARKHCWLLAINEHEPIMAASAIELLQRLQSSTPTTVQLTLHRRELSSYTNLDETRRQFDQIRPIISPIVFKPNKPQTPSNVGQALKSEDSSHWKRALCEQYEKNASIALMSKPIPRSSLPQDTKVLRSVMSFKIKHTPQDHMWKYGARHCINGAPMQQGIDYDESYSPVVEASSLRALIAIASSRRLTLGILDVTNAFQTTIKDPSKRIFATLPPFYLNWFKKYYPNVSLDPSPGPYVVQVCNGIQGDKAAGRDWNILLHKVLTQFELIRIPIDHGLYVYERDHTQLLVALSTDDFLCAYTSTDIFYRFQAHLATYFNLTRQEGPELKYLNFRIIQSEFGISMDQTRHIRESIIDPWFGTSTNVRTADTPFRTDSQFEQDLAEVLPASPDELQQLEQEYNGPYRSTLGKLNHIQQCSRPDLSYPLNRLARFSVAPSRVTFHGLKRCILYIRTHPHCPLMYPSHPFEGELTYHRHLDKDNIIKHIVTNNLAFFADTDHARSLIDRRSISSLIFTLLGTAFHWKVQCQPTVALHSTDSEIRGFYAGVKIIDYLRPLLAALGAPVHIATPTGATPGYEDNQPTIDVIKAGKVTSRVKHIAVPVAYLNEKYDQYVAEPQCINTKIQPADMGTKPVSGPLLHDHFWNIRGATFYPPITSKHYALLELHRANPRDLRRTPVSS